jgi:hypothetical protein
MDEQEEQKSCTDTAETFEVYMAKRVKERDYLMSAQRSLLAVTQLNCVRSIPNHAMTTLGWLTLQEYDIQYELERNWETKAQQIAAKQAKTA